MPDRYTEGERRRLVRFVQRRHWRSMVAAGVFIGVFVSSWWMMVIDLWLGRIGSFPSVGEWVRAAPASAAGACVALLVLLSCGPLAGLYARDHWLRWAIGKHAGESACHDCAYSLVDLPMDEGLRTCPECGEVEIVVESRGFVPARLLENGAGVSMTD